MAVIDLLHNLKPDDYFRVICGNYSCSGRAVKADDAAANSSVLSIVKDLVPYSEKWEYKNGRFYYTVKIRSTPKLKAAIEAKGGWN